MDAYRVLMRTAIQTRRGAADGIFGTQLTEEESRCSRGSQLSAGPFGVLSALSWWVWASSAPVRRHAFLLRVVGKRGLIPEVSLVEALNYTFLNVFKEIC